jgi:signal-transduction protein with cAMP-binding, CBS, and nucleotidyltransferase domain
MSVEAMRLPPPLWLDEQASLRDVARMMCGAAVSAVIVGHEAAIVTERDIVRALADGEPPDAPALLSASPGMLSVPNTTPVVDALATMLHAGVRHVVVVDAAGVPCAVLPLAAAAAVILEAASTPSWLSALRVVLRVETVDP